jgi:hypothetical protein
VQPVAGGRETGLASERLRQPGSPQVEAGIGRGTPHGEIKRHLAALGYADLVGAHQIIERGADRQRSARVGRHLEPREDGILPFEHVVHQASDGQAGRDRVAQRSGARSGRKLPGDAHRLAGVARVLPIAVPALLRGHDQRHLDLTARNGGALGDQRELHVLWTRAELRGGRDGKEHGEQEGEEAEHRPALYVIPGHGRQDPLGRRGRRDASSEKA